MDYLVGDTDWSGTFTEGGLRFLPTLLQNADWLNPALSPLDHGKYTVY